MRKLILLVFALSAVVLQQCSDDAEPYTLDRQFRVKQEEAVTINLPDGILFLDVFAISISDSRCPSNASCVRFGEAEVKLSVTGLEEVAKVVDLCIGDCPQHNQGFIESDTAQVTIDNIDYSVILIDVEPYPTTTNQSIPKEALIKIITS